MTAPALAQTGNADAAKALAELSTIESELSASLAKGDAAGLWLARRSLNAAALAADFADRKPAEAEYACFDARTALADVATTGITAIAADTIQGAAGMEARLASRKDVDDAAGLYNSMRAACAKGAGIETPSALKAPVAAGIPSLPVTAEAMLDPAAKSAMAGALAGLVTAEKALGDAVVDKPASSKDPAFKTGVAALFAFGRAQAAIPDSPALRPCRRFGGALFQLYDMAAASLDQRVARGARFDLSRWEDAVASFESARRDAAARKAECAKAIDARAAELLVPERLLARVKP